MRSLAVDLFLPLEGFSLEVSFTTRHRVTGIFGPSGSGKTSLIEAIAGLRRGARGRIVLDDQVWLDSERRIHRRTEHRRLGYVPQEGLLFPHLSVRRNLLAGARAVAGDGSAFRGIVELLEIGHLLERRPALLSGGERQRVALGRALCADPHLLLLDEPLSSLDLPLRRRLLPFLRRLRQELAVPMLLVSHDPREVQALCDHVLLLEAGRLRTAGDPAAVLADPGLVGPDGFENIIPARLLEHAEGTSRVALAVGPELVVPRSRAAVGQELLVGIPAREILLARPRPTGLSAQNILPARVVSVSAGDAVRLAVLSLGREPGAPRLRAEVTARACHDLELAPDGEVFVVLKAAGCQLYESRPP
ncbi:MAG: molybdenum ABC transporter ATP-binding protein [Acidobacteriota bacterium]